jgi:hypothetical protein
MATKYLGKNAIVNFGTVDISGTYTALEVTEEAPEAEQIDVSDKSSTVRETIEGFPGAPKTTVTLSANDEAAAASAIRDLEINDQDTLEILEQGETQGGPMRTISNARLGNRRFSTGYQSKAEWQLSFYAYETVTEGTYSTA